MFMLYAILLGLVVGVATRGRLGALGQLQFRWWPLAVGGLIVQLVLFSPLAEGVASVGPLVYVTSTAIVAVAVLTNIRQNRGFAVVAAGALCNLAAITLNGGFMPVTPEALAESGRTAATGYSNSLASAQPALDMLVDRFVLPSGLPWANVFSVGDVLIAIGIALVIVTTMHAGATDQRIAFQ